MRVTITKSGAYYSMAVTGTAGPALEAAGGPGHGQVVPHDVAHLLAEIELGLRGGVFGRVARGKSIWFPLADAGLQVRHNRKVKKWTPSPQDRADMAASERLASICGALVEADLGRDDDLGWLGRYEPGVADDPIVRRVVERCHAFAVQWRDLPSGGSIVVDWPGAPKP